MNTNITYIKNKLKPIQQWISNQALESVYSSQYWNDIEAEKKKEWWIADGMYLPCEKYLKKSGLLDEWAIVKKHLSEIKAPNKLKVADLACGIGWTTALFSKNEKIEEVIAEEISKHRLAELMPFAIDMFGGRPEIIKRYIGSFYQLEIENESLDIVFMSQGFHHANNALKLLTEIDRVLRKGGSVIFMGESYYGLFSQWKRIAKRLLTEGRICINFFENFATDKKTGDHYYRLSDYYLLFSLLGYTTKHTIINKKNLTVIANKSIK